MSEAIDRGLRQDRKGSKPAGGFALVITVVLLALLVLVVFALSTVTRVGTAVAETGGFQVQARQHALLGLGQAMGQLQRDGSADDRLTGMAGITGLPAGAGQPARQWCGVWTGTGALQHWLVSGGEDLLIPGLGGADSLALVAQGSLGAEGNDREHVRVQRVEVSVSTTNGTARLLGGYAWWVGDEGVKLSAVLPGEKQAIDELISLAPDAPRLAGALTYEQIALVPTGVTPTALAGQLRANFHVLGRTHLSPLAGVNVPGRLNINTNAHRFWRGVAATYNRLKPASAPALSAPIFADRLIANFVAADPGAAKAEGGPYPSVDLFLNSAALTQALAAGGGTLQAFGDVMRPWLAVRSDTFRIRAYGDAVNPAEPGKIESAAWLEAMVQRIKDDPASSQGHFIIIGFRWLGPEEI